MKNTITGTTQADCAILTIDAGSDLEAGLSTDGQCREHALIAHRLGIEQLIIAVNKMDKTQWSEARFQEIVKETSKMISAVGYDPEAVAFVPISGYNGDNIVHPSLTCSWYQGWGKKTKVGKSAGKTLLDAIDSIEPPKRPDDMPLRLPIQAVYKIEAMTVLVGRIEAGVIKPGTVIQVAPFGLTAEVKALAMHHKKIEKGVPGDSVVVSLDAKQVSPKDIKRGYVIGDSKNKPPQEARSFVAQITVINTKEIRAGYSPVVDCHTAHISCRFDQLKEKIDCGDGKTIETAPGSLKPGDCAIVTMVPAKAMCVEAFADYPALGRIAIRDNKETVAVGIIRSVEEKHPIYKK